MSLQGHLGPTMILKYKNILYIKIFSLLMFDSVVCNIDKGILVLED